MPGHRGVHRVGSSALVGALACVMIATPVFAFASRSTRTVTVPSGKEPVFRSSTATCPSGQHVQFGGYKNGVAGMHRAGTNHWTVDGFNLGGQRLLLTSFAYCAHGAVPTEARSNVTIRAAGSATARCPAGKVVVAGGFAASRHSVLAVTRFERVAANALRVSAYLRFGITKKTTLTAIAYCASGPAPTRVSRTVNTKSGGGRVAATCPAGKTLAFGGVIARPTPHKMTLVLSMHADTDSTWSVANTTAGTLTALAFCR